MAPYGYQGAVSLLPIANNKDPVPCVRTHMMAPAPCVHMRNKDMQARAILYVLTQGCHGEGVSIDCQQQFKTYWIKADTSPELIGRSVLYQRLRFGDFIFYPFGIIVGGGAAVITITEALRILVRSDQQNICSYLFVQDFLKQTFMKNIKY